MEPKFSEGQTVTFNKCIEGKTENLKVGTIVLTEKSFQPEEIVVIRKKITVGSTVSYTVSGARDPSSTKDIPTSLIKAIYEGN